MSELDKEEMLRIKPFIESGWPLKAALGYESKSLTYAHNIRQLTDRAVAQGGNFTLVLDRFTISVTQDKSEPAAQL